jgi:hypothetical protein|tara:strand:+ start:5476 stop:5772 length:297 start_codon:yes stop_codon:yes gene_type:complete
MKIISCDCCAKQLNPFSYITVSKSETVEVYPDNNEDLDLCDSCWGQVKDLIDSLYKENIEGDVCADPFSGSNPMKKAIDGSPNLYAKINTAYTNCLVP